MSCRGQRECDLRGEGQAQSLEPGPGAFGCTEEGFWACPRRQRRVYLAACRTLPSSDALPMPFLRTESAPFRVIIRGEVKRWTVKKAEDLRTFTQAQLKEKVFCEDWVIAVFGSTAKDKDYWED